LPPRKKAVLTWEMVMLRNLAFGSAIFRHDRFGPGDGRSQLGRQGRFFEWLRSLSAACPQKEQAKCGNG
jgi:hypothetical protein